MTTDERLERIETAIEILGQDNRAILERLEVDSKRYAAENQAVLEQLEASRQELREEVKRWDERFFQLSRDTLNFTRAVVTTAAIVAVLIPFLKDVAPLLIELVKEGSR
ncbi:MAG: hypothetical protein Q6M04_09835 [Thermostichus sp. BF3_bins_97]